MKDYWLGLVTGLIAGSMNTYKIYQIQGKK